MVEGTAVYCNSYFFVETRLENVEVLLSSLDFRVSCLEKTQSQKQMDPTSYDFDDPSRFWEYSSEFGSSYVESTPSYAAPINPPSAPASMNPKFTPSYAAPMNPPSSFGAPLTQPPLSFGASAAARMQPQSSFGASLTSMRPPSSYGDWAVAHIQPQSSFVSQTPLQLSSLESAKPFVAESAPQIVSASTLLCFQQPYHLRLRRPPHNYHFNQLQCFLCQLVLMKRELMCNP